MKASVKSSVAVMAVLLIGAAVSYAIVSSAPKPGKKSPHTQARLVDAMPLVMTSARPLWRSGGVVSAAEQVTLTPQVSGEIVSLSAQAIPGARLAKDDVLAQLQQADYELLVQQRQAAVVQAQADLTIERGEAALAKEEYNLAAQSMSAQDRALVLREPQVAKAEAALRKARADLQQAQLDLQRTQIRMPFAGQIVGRDASTGKQVAAGTALFDVVRTDTFWIEVKVPRSFLAWVDTEAAVTVRQPNWQAQQSRQARIVSILPQVDSSDRQSKLLLAIDQPLDELPHVLVNDYVDVTLAGREITDAYAVSVNQLNDDGSVWLIREQKLRRVTPDVIYRGREQVWMQGDIQPGDQLLLSRIDAITDGMAVRIASDSTSNDASNNLSNNLSNDG
ncbi:hypothetical protein CHH28_16160 [Bacterioplanes sanyensis]|uniref:RND efflux pump membrane fusion protein barrel-sandwich domain-containing protein n=1 Tax=Bacterioplanes sanyensis TaxID=1249553 RepID=A0A222FN53_9GAMM|nr:efflux RND transporter periplasmic adaptor subunit [Bacterioplanes sanyensis]ASP40112.1 hypothetical protein CHH28_16160 [Bacterioplanes sanyensis]